MQQRVRRILVGTLASACASVLAACAATGDRDTASESAARVESLASLMVGSYSSAAQAVADPEFRDIRLEMVRIWADRDDGPWIYIEQAAADALDRPYRQRVYRLQPSVDPDRATGTIESRTFELPGDPLHFAGAWKETARFDVLRPIDLIPRDGCTVFLEWGRDGSPGGYWFGATDAESCPSSLRGASYATSEVDITDGVLRSWDRGFDATGRQVWGAVKGPYEFVRATVNDRDGRDETRPVAR